MRFRAFSLRCAKEIIRDPLSIVFGVGFPVVLLVFMSVLKKSIKDMPDEMFAPETFTPGMMVFGASFIMLFLGMLVMNDRNSSFLPRLYSSPMTVWEYALGYVLPMIPIGVLQSVFCVVVSFFIGLKPSVKMLVMVFFMIFVTLMFASLGLLLGALFNTQALNGAGTVIINLSALLSGTWFSLDLVGGRFRDVCLCLPFAHAVNMVSASLLGDNSAIFTDFLYLIGYTAVFFAVAMLIFKRKMKNA